MKKIKQRGIMVCWKTLVSLACDTFGLRMADSDSNKLVKPTYISDVFRIIMKHWKII